MSDELARQRKEEVEQIKAQNPWLSLEDCIKWQKIQEEARRTAVRCCPCMGREPGVVRHFLGSVVPGDPAYALGPCRCGCHKKRP
jgi:hypothetical protein